MLAAGLALACAGCGSSRHHTTPVVVHTSPPPSHTLATGLTEPNPSLVWSAAARTTLPPGFAPWRDRVAALHPTYDRVLIDWAALQPDPSRPADLSGPRDGCQRGIAPCAPYASISDEFAAIASQQQAEGGWHVVIVIYGVPAWAALGPSGCERRGTTAFSRPITTRGLVGYQALIAQLVALGRRDHVALDWWAPWNEPNHPGFISPQRSSCSRSAPIVSADAYAQLVRAAQAQLRASRVSYHLVLGELAAYTRPSRFATTAPQFMAALPDDVACAGTVWSIHAYAHPPPGVRPLTTGPLGRSASVPLKGSDPVVALEQALDARSCSRGAHVWVDETGAGSRRDGVDPSRRASCAALVAALARWSADPRVDAAVQYTFRDDPLFPVGLADASLTRLWPAYGVWVALAHGRVPAAADCAPASGQ